MVSARWFIARPIVCIGLVAAISVSCRSSHLNVPIVEPGAPGKPTREISAKEAVDLHAVRATDADVQFMQGMIGHHQQAVEMAELLATHTSDAAMRKLGQRIEISQTDEIRMMRQWLTGHHQEVPDEHALHMHGATLMPGMLSPEEMDHLAAAKGTAFDRLFLEGMIKHHGGALTMVADLFSHAGAGQDPDIFTFVSDVDADQRAEIARMSAMLEELQK
jgi:uncharacterized protein (DUF305 family)